MKRLKTLLSKDFSQHLTFNHYIALLFSLLLAISSFITDKTNLPKGWELTKVYFLTLCCLVLLWLMLVHGVYESKSFKQKSKNLASNLCIGLLLLTLSISTIFFQYERVIVVSKEHNFIYKFLLDLLYEHNKVLVNQSLFGNEFRDFGLFTFLIFFIFLWNFKNCVTKTNINFIFLSLSIASVIQSAIAFTQYLDIKENNPHVLKDGLYIYGTFGQTNFYSGFILVGLICKVYFVFYFKSKYLKLLALLVLVATLPGVLVTYSMWFYPSALFALLLILAFAAVKQKMFSKILVGTTALVFILIPFAIKIAANSTPGYEHRLNIWQAIIDRYTKMQIPERFVFGSGFDNLQNTLRPSFPNSYIDRAHNIFGDVFTTFGLVGFALFCGFLVYLSYRYLKLENASLQLNFLAILTGVWLVRSYVHENSVINVFQFMLIIMVLYKMIKEEDNLVVIHSNSVNSSIVSK